MNIKTICTLALLTGASVSLSAQTPAVSNPAEREKSAKEIAFTAAYRERDSAKVIRLGEQFLKDYPFAATDHKADKAAYIEYFKIYLNLITKSKASIEEKIKEYYDVLPYFTVAELYYRQVYLLNLHKIEPAEKLLPRSELLMKKFAYYQHNKPVEFVWQTDEEWQKLNDRNYFGNLLTHVNLLRKTGHTKAGLTAADEALSHYGYAISSLNEDDVLLLQAAGLKEKMQKALEASVNSNQATPLMLDLLKQNYLAKNKDQGGFDAYVESLKSQEAKAGLEKELAKSMIKKEIPSFALYDGNGKLVDTKDLKGKIIVLDFFASWCVPCKAAFPGMKMAQEKFAGDKDVVFYFVDVHEHIKDNKPVVMKYIKDNDFPFNILFDKEEQVANLLKVTAIPRKMILDKNGVLRFDMDGYYGSPSKLADEIKIMVNLTKKAI